MRFMRNGHYAMRSARSTTVSMDPLNIIQKYHWEHNF